MRDSVCVCVCAHEEEEREREKVREFIKRYGTYCVQGAFLMIEKHRGSEKDRERERERERGEEERERERRVHGLL